MNVLVPPVRGAQALGWTLWFSTGLFMVLALRYQYYLLRFMEFGDESETILTAKMIVSGMPLYEVIFNHHGPLTFLPGIIVELFGDFSVSGHRAAVVVMQWAALGAIYFSPLSAHRNLARLHLVLAASVIVLFLPQNFGHMYIYQVLAGLMLMVILAQYSLPQIALPGEVSRPRLIMGNLLIASLPFLAITYLPLAILLGLASIRRESWREALLWLCTGALLNIGFLAVVGSLKGFFAYHIYLNLRILPEFQPGETGIGALIYTAFGSATGNLSLFLLLSLVIIATAKLGSAEKGFPWRSVFIALGLGSLLIRGANFHGIAFYYAALAMPLAFLATLKKAEMSALVLIALVLVCAVKVSLLFPADRQHLRSQRIPTETDFSRLVQRLTEPEDRIISYSFQNYQYLAANRLPASGHFFYLPWQARYNESPLFGIKTDPCEDIRIQRPKVMALDRWKVWDSFEWHSYAGCIDELVEREYSQLAPHPYYLRNDLIAHGGGPLPPAQTNPFQYPSTPLGRDASIPLRFTAGHLNTERPLRRLGLRLATYMRTFSGSAELVLQGEAGSVRVPIDLSQAQDNQYLSIDLPTGQYQSAELRMLEGEEGLSVWEVHYPDDSPVSCLNYEYADGSMGFTPGCPPF